MTIEEIKDLKDKIYELEGLLELAQLREDKIEELSPLILARLSALSIAAELPQPSRIATEEPHPARIAAEEPHPARIAVELPERSERQESKEPPIAVSSRIAAEFPQPARIATEPSWRNEEIQSEAAKTEVRAPFAAKLSEQSEGVKTEAPTLFSEKCLSPGEIDAGLMSSSPSEAKEPSLFSAAELPQPSRIAAEEPQPSRIAVEFPQPSHIAAEEPQPSRIAVELPERSERQEKLEKPKNQAKAPIFCLNDRFRFRKTLFGGSETEFSEAMKSITEMDSYEEAEQYFLDSYNWDPEDPEVTDFLEILAIYYES